MKLTPSGAYFCDCAPSTDLATNTTEHLLADVELARRHLNVDQWLVFGGSWDLSPRARLRRAVPGASQRAGPHGRGHGAPVRD